MSFLSKLLGAVSGNNGLIVSEQLLFDKVIGFRGVVPGVGTSTIVQNTAIALSETTNFSVCVLDASFLYPTQYPMLINSTDSKRTDFLDFAGDVSDVAISTSYRNVSLVSLYDRTIVDMMSSRDSELTVEKLIGTLKSYFDVILIDLSYELTNISTHMAIKCNRIINIADQSLKSVYHLRKSINTMATLAVPLAKANKVILNKVIPDVLTNTKGVIEDAGLEVIGEIPISLDLAKYGVSGKAIWEHKTTNPDVYAFSKVINTILEDVIQKTPLNAKYTDKELVEQAKAGKKDKKVKKAKEVLPEPEVVESEITSEIEEEVIVEPKVTPVEAPVEAPVEVKQPVAPKAVVTPSVSAGVEEPRGKEVIQKAPDAPPVAVVPEPEKAVAVEAVEPVVEEPVQAIVEEPKVEDIIPTIPEEEDEEGFDLFEDVDTVEEMTAPATEPTQPVEEPKKKKRFFGN